MVSENSRHKSSVLGFSKRNFENLDVNKIFIKLSHRILLNKEYGHKYQVLLTEYKDMVTQMQSPKEFKSACGIDLQ